MATIKMDRAERLIGYTFTRRDLLWEALQVAGSGQARIGDRDTSKGNERLAIVGNGVLTFSEQRVVSYRREQG